MSREEIIKLRKRLDLSQEKFAALLGVSRITIVNWENGNNKPSYLALEKLEHEKKLLG